jgi:hypothetical protein
MAIVRASSACGSRGATSRGGRGVAGTDFRGAATGAASGYVTSGDLRRSHAATQQLKQPSVNQKNVRMLHQAKSRSS